VAAARVSDSADSAREPLPTPAGSDGWPDGAGRRRRLTGPGICCRARPLPAASESVSISSNESDTVPSESRGLQIAGGRDRDLNPSPTVPGPPISGRPECLARTRMIIMMPGQ
jgi:hypothetical protein